jgi:hypothetical protein
VTANTRDPRVARPEDNRWSDGPPLPRRALWLMLPGILAPIAIFGFILLSETAHDDARCPYRELSRREVAAQVVVVEEVRNCIADVEEHRYTLRRGAHAQLLGERRFARADFAAERYAWSAKVSEQGEVQVVIKNQGHPDLLLREGTAEERAKGISH